MGLTRSQIANKRAFAGGNLFGKFGGVSIKNLQIAYQVGPDRNMTSQIRNV